MMLSSTEPRDASAATSSWSLFDLIPKETCIDEKLKEYTAPNGCNHFFITQKTPLIGQALHIGRRIEQLLRRYHSAVAGPNTEPGEIWLHGVGSLAIQRTIELALHLENRMYPGHVKTEVKTSTCTTVQKILSAIDPLSPTVQERERSKSAIHVQLKLIATHGQFC